VILPLSPSHAHTVVAHVSPDLARCWWVIVFLLRSYMYGGERNKKVQIEKATISSRAHSRVAEYLVRLNRSRLRREGVEGNNCLLLLYVHYVVLYGPAQQQWHKTKGTAIAGPLLFASEIRETQYILYVFNLLLSVDSGTGASCL
jgi:hypothetical protein